MKAPRFNRTEVRKALWARFPKAEAIFFDGEYDPEEACVTFAMEGAPDGGSVYEYRHGTEEVVNQNTGHVFYMEETK